MKPLQPAARQGKSAVSAYVLLGTIAFFWGLNYAVVKVGLESLDPLLFLVLRFGISAVIMFGLLRWFEGSVGIRLKDLWKFIVLGLIGTTMLESFVVVSINYTTLANSSILSIAPWPIFAAIFAPLFTKEKIRKSLLGYGLLSMAGVVMVILAGGSFSLDSDLLLGNLLAFAVSVCGGFYSAACIPLLKTYSSLRMTTWMFAFGTLFMLPFAYPAFGTTDWVGMGWPAIGALAFNVIVITIVCFLLWNKAMPQIGAATASFYRYLTPLAAVLSGVVFFQEPVYSGQLVGAALMFMGLIGISLPTRAGRRAKQESAAG
ncbi:DMT family transporter [Paenibacillus silvisoli]|uniref:DMT family transporter n=1 Tax=Paenibacillus silvisoli TaxID=3110539 RepID=UPI002805DE26|nr:DMT family transporter [Paenibacillus silvisoli]